MAVTEEMIMAYADGELDAVGCGQVEAAMAADAEIAGQVEAHRALRTRFASAFAGVLEEPAPERLLAAARKPPAPTGSAPDNIVSLERFRALKSAPAAPARSRWAQWGAVAAVLAVGLFVGQLWFGRPATQPAGAPLAVNASGGIAARGVLATALDDQLASNGKAGANRAVVIGVSFRSSDQRYCRTFQLNQGQGQNQGLAGVACRDPSGWAVRMAMASGPQAATSGYRTAASETPTPVLDAVQGMIAGDPLDAKGEAAAKAAGWRP